MVRNLVLASMIVLLNGCHKDIPDPEVKKSIEIEPMHVVRAENEVVVLGLKPDHSFSVQHHVKEKNVYVECFIPDISFTERETSLMVSVDGIEKKMVHTAAFIVKGLPSGAHQVRLQVIDKGQVREGLKREFEVIIP